MGYLAFPIAERYLNTEVIGLDIVDKALGRNRKKAEIQGLKNLHFVSYHGLTFPFEEEEFDMVITRYALHHFPAIKDTFREINRVLKPNGLFFLSDPAPNEDDIEGFVDAYMQMKQDGHIKFYAKKEWLEMGGSVGFHFVDGFETKIRFPKKKQAALEFEYIMKKFDKQIINGYEVEVIEDEIWISERVNNLLFRKSEG